MYVVQMKALDALAILESRLEDVVILATSFPSDFLGSQEHACEKRRRQVNLD